VNYVRPHEAQDYRIHASPLHLACKSNHLAVVSHLLSLGADVHLRINPVSQSDLLRLAGLLTLSVSLCLSLSISLSLTHSLSLLVRLIRRKTQPFTLLVTLIWTPLRSSSCFSLTEQISMQKIGSVLSHPFLVIWLIITIDWRDSCSLRSCGSAQQSTSFVSPESRSQSEDQNDGLDS
jgi:hypothetical protein